MLRILRGTLQMGVTDIMTGKSLHFSAMADRADLHVMRTNEFSHSLACANCSRGNLYSKKKE